MCMYVCVCIYIYIIKLYTLNLQNILCQYISIIWGKHLDLIILIVVSVLKLSLENIKGISLFSKTIPFLWHRLKRANKEYPSRKIEQLLILLSSCQNSKIQQPLAERVLKGFIYLIISPLHFLTLVLLSCNIRQNAVLTIASLSPS